MMYVVLQRNAMEAKKASLKWRYHVKLVSTGNFFTHYQTISYMKWLAVKDFSII